MARLVISQNERILLHLAEFDRHRDDPGVPLAVSQEGIAQRLDTQVHNASRALASLEAEGLVFDRLAHVRGAPKRRRAYFLSDRGRAAAHTIRSDIGKRKLMLEHAGMVQELTVDEAVRKLGPILGRPPGFAEVVELGRQFDTVLSSALISGEIVEKPQLEFMMRTHGRPKVESFFGREKEQKTLEEAISGRNVSAILVHGIPGVGKSTLASRVFESLVGKRHLFWYSFREWDSELSLLSALGDFLISVGHANLASAIKRGTSASELFGPLSIDLAECNPVLFLDDVQKPAREPSTALAMLSEAAKSSGTTKLIMISRVVPSFFSKATPGNLVIQLAGLDRDSAWRLAQSLNAEDGVRLVEESHGHPLLLMLMARFGQAQAKGDIISFIEREVYSSSSREEREALELISVYRHPAPLDALPGVDYATIAGLRKRALVAEQEEGISTHDLIREFFLNHMNSDVKATQHSKAARYCEKQDGVEWKLEALNHYIEAGDWASAGKVSVANATDLAKEFPDDTLLLVSKLNMDSLPKNERAEITFLRGQLHESLGRPGEALFDFEMSLSYLDAEADTERRAIVIETVAKLQSLAKRWSESLSGYDKALKLYEKSDDVDGQIREWMNMGGVFRQRGDFEDARGAYSKALELATRKENRQSQAACLNNLALLLWDEGNQRDAEIRLKESIKLAHAVKDHAGEASALENLSNLMRSQGRMDDAASLMIESSEAFMRAGEIADFKRLQATCAEMFGIRGRLKEGIGLCEKVLKQPEYRRRRGLFQKAQRHALGDISLSSTLVELLRASGELKAAGTEASRYVSIAESMGDHALVAKGKILISMIKEDSGDLEAAAGALGEAESLLRADGNSNGLIAVHMRLGTIEEKRGNYSAAVKQYQEAARHAELVDDKYALTLARDNIASIAKGDQ